MDVIDVERLFHGRRDGREGLAIDVTYTHPERGRGREGPSP